mgnify:CR=1 FL=1
MRSYFKKKEEFNNELTFIDSESRLLISGIFDERCLLFSCALNGRPDGGGGMINSLNDGGI